MLKFFFFSSFLLLGFFSQNIHGEECPVTDCADYDIKKLIESGWKTPKVLTPLIKEYRDAIIELSADCNERDLINLLAQTTWSTVQLGNLKASNGGNCVMRNVLKKILKSGVGEEKASLIKKYTNLCTKAIMTSRDIGMEAAGCMPEAPTSPEFPKTKNPCKSDDLVETAFSSPKSEMPEKLKSIVTRLVNSDNHEESVIGTTALVSSTTPLVDYFDRLAKQENWLTYLKVYSCFKPIPSACCDERKEYLLKASTALDNDSVVSGNKMGEKI